MLEGKQFIGKSLSTMFVTIKTCIKKSKKMISCQHKMAMNLKKKPNHFIPTQGRRFSDRRINSDRMLEM